MIKLSVKQGTMLLTNLFNVISENNQNNKMEAQNEYIYIFIIMFFHLMLQ